MQYSIEISVPTSVMRNTRRSDIKNFIYVKCTMSHVLSNTLIIGYCNSVLINLLYFENSGKTFERRSN